MCGICGIYDGSRRMPSRGELMIMSRRLAHRGPDDEGYYCAPGIGLGHRRLSIIDVATGRQPLYSEDKKIALVINGEIYNFKELRHRLEQRGHVFTTRTDVEVIPHLYEEHTDDFVDHLRGMFSLALWDSAQEKLILARDRAGEKPLCYWQSDGNIVFASELQALLSWPLISREIDPDALDTYLGLQYVPAPGTMIQGVRKLEPSHMLVVQKGTVKKRRYWRLLVQPGVRRSQRDYEQGIRDHLAEAVKLRMVSDAPLGVLLSGGMDSSAVLSYAAKHTRGMQAFSIGFSEAAYNELPFARLAAQAAGARHLEQIITPQIADILPQMVRHYGEPFADSSAVPTWYLAQFVSGRAKVVLSGDGGDEMFGGYDRYRAWQASTLYDVLPGWLRRGISRSASLLGTGGDVHSASARWRRFLRAAALDPAERYLSWMGAFSPQERRTLYCSPRSGPAGDVQVFQERWPRHLSSVRPDDVWQVDAQTYLPDDLLVKVDIASMAFGVEVRAVFLDHVLMEYAAGIPWGLKIRAGRGKHILRRALQRQLPAAIINRDKQGFGVPLYEWLKGPLYSLAEGTLCSQTLKRRGLFQSEYIRQLLNELRHGVDHSYRLWTLLMFELWCREFLDKAAEGSVERVEGSG